MMKSQLKRARQREARRGAKANKAFAINLSPFLRRESDFGIANHFPESVASL